jgi:hypothetical protein
METVVLWDIWTSEVGLADANMNVNDFDIIRAFKR